MAVVLQVTSQYICGTFYTARIAIWMNDNPVIDIPYPQTL